ncbi:hypothetical protein COT50_03425 [candidate division WWE3 bacterium CG08_land_8_20_14_0_20_41_10]|uniref:PIN domain-containing protein n=1 Tax=candidate division WWE3 bacterium CG08_land_8_20_14_0_20_41_10 TaxID=1975085 RepID=A0A2H0XB69_UNCKA|nr:MAG: hypothetical protein COT50_03425 [candidate division WWE3 bacterium CG08_land_8_20_14_0_20_41_10]
MKNLYADTNTLVSLLIKRNKDQTDKVEKVFQEAQGGKIKIVIIPEILMEVYFVLHSNYNINRDDMYLSLNSLVSSTQLDVRNRSLLLEALEIYKEVSMSLLDIYLYLTAKNNNAEVFSFDKDLEKLKQHF